MNTQIFRFREVELTFEEVRRVLAKKIGLLD